ncbi:MAG: xanthine dehydrogenase family protein molybdopterin-binding subunit [Deltaproteobacteria bacterium]|nr:xanthine dehydrogenase family protein molybdopterin-binding subunit [Deltaproteobacteria bacterium]
MAEQTEIRIDGKTFKVAKREAILEGMPEWKSSELNVVGKRIARTMGPDNVTGRAKYAYDVYLQGMLYAKVLRSPHAHARIKKIDTSKAEALPGVRGVITYQNTKRKWDDERNILNETVKMAGEEVAVVAAESETTAEDARALIEVEYEVLPAVVDPEKAMQPNAPKLQPYGNVFGGKPQVYNRGDVEKGFAEADIIHEQRYTTAYQQHACMELHGCVAQWERGQFTMWDTNQGIHLSKDLLALKLGLPITKVRVINEHTGGGFGSKTGIYPYPLVVAELAKKTGRPVRLFMDRNEEFVVAMNRPYTVQYYKGGVKRDGTLTALYHRVIGQAGPYKENAIWAARASEDTEEVYHCANVRAEKYHVHNNVQAPRPCRAPGGTENMFTLEQLMDELAEKVGMDPVEFRKKNAARYDQVANKPWGSNGYVQCLETGAKEFGWKTPSPGKPDARKKRGIGCSSVFWHGNQSEQSQAVVIVHPDATAELLAGISGIGVGAETLPMESVRITYGDSQGTPYTLNAAYGSRTTALSGPGVRAAAHDARRQLLKLAAARLRAKPEEVEIREGKAFVKADPKRSIPLREATRRIGRELIIGTGKRPPNLDGYEVDAFGAAFAEVEVDTVTGEVKLLRAVSVHDSGRIINPRTAENQVQGGFIWGVGAALFEDRVLDPHRGIHLNANFNEYRLPTALDVGDEIKAVFVETDEITNSIGAKALGEPPTTGAGAAIANAVYHAIGIRVRNYPITPARVLEALRRKA